MWIIWAYAEKKEDLEKDWSECHRTRPEENHIVVRLFPETKYHGEEMNFALIYELIPKQVAESDA